MRHTQHVRLILLTFTWFFAYTTGAQPWTAIGPNDGDQPTHYLHTSDIAMTSDRGKGCYISFSQILWSPSYASQYKISVRRWNGNSWQDVGTPGISAGDVRYHSITTAPGPVPFIAYSDYTVNRRAIVKKWDGSSWTTIGVAVSPGTSEYTSLATDAAGVPYLAYVDSPANRTVSVKKWDGSNWQTLGAANFTAVGVKKVKLIIDRSGTPRLLVQYPVNCEVYKYNGASWISEGLPAGTGTVEYTDMALLKNDTALVTYTEVAASRKAVVKKFNGTNWVTVGGAYATNAASEKVQLDVDSNNVAYLFCKTDSLSGGSNAYCPAIRRFNGSIWEKVGPDSLIVRRQTWGNEALILDTAGTPHVMLYDYKIRLLKLTAGGWQEQGSTAGITNGAASITKVVPAPDGKTAFAIMGGDYFDGYAYNGKVYQYNNGWNLIGQSGINGLKGLPTDIAIGADGNPWVLLRDSATPNRFSVYRRTSNVWVYAGLRDTASIITMIADNSGNILIAALSANSMGTRLHKFNGTSWSKTQIFNSGSSFRYMRLRTNAAGDPYILVGSHISTHPNYLYAFGVFKYDGTNWVSLGGTFNTANGTYWQGDPDLAIDSAGIPYVSYVNTGQYQAKVQKYDAISGNWTDVVSLGNIPSYTFAPMIQFDQAGTLYLCYGDRFADPIPRAVVKRLSGNAWQNVGSGTITKSMAETPALAVLNNSMLLLFNDGAAYAYKYDCAQPAAITAQPRDTALCTAGDARFIVKASGATAYLWQYNAGRGWLNVSNITGTTGTADDTLNISGVSRALNGTRFRCVLSNACGGINISETAALKVDTSSWPISVVTVTADKAYTCAGAPATFRAAATNKGVTYTYAWYVNGNLIPSANDSAYTGTLNPGDSVRSLFTRISACGLPPAGVNSNLLKPVVNTTAAPTVTISAAPGTVIFQGQPITFTATITNGGVVPQYQWLRNGNPISGANADNYILNTPANGDVITLQVKRADTCANPSTVTSAGITLTQWPADINNVTTNETAVMLYPQPARDYATLSGLNTLKPGLYHISLFDLMGREVYSHPMLVETGTNTLRMALPGSLSSGTYRLKLSGAEQLVTLPLIIAR